MKSILDNINLNKVTCEFVKGSRINLDAEKVYLELQSIQNQNINNQLIPEEVLDWIECHPNSELYNGIDWDDKEAARKWRLTQVTKIIYNIRIIPLENNNYESKHRIEIRPYANLKDDDRYQSIVTVVNDETKYEKLKQQALRDLESWKNKYIMITELKDLFEQIDLLIAK